MLRLLAGTALLASTLAPALAQNAARDKVTEGRSVGICSNTMLVCAFARDGHATATSECKAQQAGAARILPGDCDDPD